MTYDHARAILVILARERRNQQREVRDMTIPINDRERNVRWVGTIGKRRIATDEEFGDDYMHDGARKTVAYILDDPFAFEQDFDGLSADDYSIGERCAAKALATCKAIHVAHVQTWHGAMLTDADWERTWAPLYRLHIARWQDDTETVMRADIASYTIMPPSHDPAAKLDRDLRGES